MHQNYNHVESRPVNNHEIYTLLNIGFKKIHIHQNLFALTNETQNPQGNG